MPAPQKLPRIKPVLDADQRARLGAPVPVPLTLPKGVATAALPDELCNHTGLAGILDDAGGLRNFLETVFALSPYLQGLARLEVEALHLACDAGFASAIADAHHTLEAAAAEAAEAADDAAIMAHLRRAKRRVALIAGLADMGGWWSAMEVSRAVSDIADKTVRLALSHVLAAQHRRGKLLLPDPKRPETGCGYAIIAMGKHGARELNYSSDIDLIAFFDPESPALADPLEGVDTFNRVTRQLLKLMQERTGDGYVFRTDFRLRPDPGSMPLAVPMPLALHYYESRGQNWERAAFIKARCIAGDEPVGNEILASLQPFVWRRYLDYAAIQDIHSIKRQVQAHRGYEQMAIPGHNVKLGRGGIREIEFFAQTQQLIAGGRRADLRSPTTLGALERLEELGWIDAEVREDLHASYHFLRDVEHRLQMVQDEQTHTIPEDEAGRKNIAAMCGFTNLTAFEKAALAHFNRVENHYADLFSEGESLSTELGNLSFTGDDDDPGTLASLSSMGFERPSDMIALVRGWHFGRYRAMQSSQAREALTEMTPELLRCFARMGRPDATMVAFDTFLKGLPAGVQLFSLLRINPQMLDLLALVLSSAPRLAAIITRRPHVFDGLLEPGFFDHMPEREELRTALRHLLGQAQGYEDELDRLRQFASEQKFLIGLRALAGGVSPTHAGIHFTSLSEVMTGEALRVVEREFSRRHGVVEGAELVVVGMGNLGSAELTAGSDLDLILLYDAPDQLAESDGEKPLAAVQYFARLTQRLIAAMSAPTAEGVIYELDFRLRPSGNAGPLATSFASFCRYQRKEAWTWERMALTRARVVAGDAAFADRVEAEIDTILSEPGSAKKTASEIWKMRKLMDKERPASSPFDIKLVQGGLIDLEFIAQWAVLCRGVDRHGGTRAVLERLKDGLKDPTLPIDNVTLLSAFDRYAALLQVLRICLEDAYSVEDAPMALTERVARMMEEPDIKRATLTLKEQQRTVRAVLKTVLGRD